jgi:xanthine dehydrogenase accessory factor
MNGPDQIWKEAVRALERGKPFVMATVTGVRGSTPREVGAKMIVRDDGQFGTIGGGCGEAEVFRKARVLLEKNEGPQMAEVDLTGDFDQREIGTCGGIMDVFIDIWTPEFDMEFARKLADAADHRTPAALLTVVESGPHREMLPGARTILEPGKPAEGIPPALACGLDAIAERARAAVAGVFELGAGGSVTAVTRQGSASGTRIFVDPIVGARRLIIAGAGHIAQPLAAMGAMLGYHVTVIDDRASFANRDRFAQADEIIVMPFERAIESLNLDAHCYLVSVTRGHSFDEETVRTALKTPCGFVGMIGSRRRVRATIERLAEQGVPRERLDELHAPLGVDIGAETPEEIALSIIAEIVRERRVGVRDDFSLGVKSGLLKRREP